MSAIAFPWFGRTVTVVPECMGYRSVIAMSLLVALCAVRNRLTLLRSVALLFVAAAIALCGNAFRMLAILAVSTVAPDFGFGLWHDICGYAFFMLAVAAMAAVAAKMAGEKSKGRRETSRCA